MFKKANSGTFLITSIFFLLILCPVAIGKIIYVDDNAAGANDGSSWENAYIYLQEALADANSSEKPIEIRVAQGVYRPNEGLVAIPEFDWRTATFQLINGVTLIGGYAGVGSPDPNARDIELYETILSGDLNGDDVEVTDPCDLLNEPTRADNSYHVVTGSNTDKTATLDGFTITAGNANDSNENYYGAGMCNDFGCPTVANCTFRSNSATDSGGGMGNINSSPTTVINCIFQGNSAGEDGGGIDISFDSTATVTNCTFSRNSAGENGGGMCNDISCDTIVTNCIFIDNLSGLKGGGMYNCVSRPTVTNCEFNGNKAVGSGGGMCNGFFCDMIAKNCIFTGNSSYEKGGGIASFGSRPVLNNCTFTGNRASYGNALACDLGYDLDGNERTSHVRSINCIIWDGNINGTWSENTSTITISHSCIQGGWPAEDNIDADPLFAKPGYWDTNATPDDANDDFWMDGDYHLKSQAGRYDPNSESWVVDDVTSPCIDAGDPNSPVGDEPEPNGGRINMGAYGGTVEASMSLTGVTVTIYIQWLGHASVKVWTEDIVVYVDPWLLSESPHDATAVLVTHSHDDHYSLNDIISASNDDTVFIAPPDVVQLYGNGQTIAPEQTIQLDGFSVTGIAAYNINKPRHPKSKNWVGFIIELGGKRIYAAGDTDLTEEVKAVENIDVAFLPVSGGYAMSATEAAEATQYIQPQLAIPYHWGIFIGNLNDAQTFAEQAACPVKIMSPGEIINSDDWLE